MLPGTSANSLSILKARLVVLKKLRQKAPSSLRFRDKAETVHSSKVLLIWT